MVLTAAEEVSVPSTPLITAQMSLRPALEEKSASYQLLNTRRSFFQVITKAGIGSQPDLGSNSSSTTYQLPSVSKATYLKFLVLKMRILVPGVSCGEDYMRRSISNA